MNPAEIRAWTAANKRARREYYAHPLLTANGGHKGCDPRMCEVALNRMLAGARKNRAYRLRKKGQQS